ncbi:MAG: hypothetical protein ACXAD7_04135 [Candidatus Kariarchaeaceae archaeon]|jgi:DNA-binding HxlR family transcriptional regulator
MAINNIDFITALKQFLLKQNYFSDTPKTIEEIAADPRFEILSMLYFRDSMSIESIKKGFNIEKLLNNILHQLEQKNLITNLDDGTWGLSESLVNHLQDEPPSETVSTSKRDTEDTKDISESKIKSRKPESFLDPIETKSDSAIKSRIRAELLQKDNSTPKSEEDIKTSDIEDLFDDVLDMSMEDFLEDFEDIIIVEEKGGKPVISGPIIEILKNQGYIKEDVAAEEDLQKVPEYEILSIIIKEHPIPLNKIEENTELESVSLVLSNLQADDLIMQTNDYRWTISNKVRENLKDYVKQRKEKELHEKEQEPLRSLIDKKSEDQKQFVSAMLKLGYISSDDIPLARLMQIPDFNILRTIKDNEPLDIDEIKNQVSDIPPVQVTRMLSRLEGDNRITRDVEGRWELTGEFVKILVGAVD